MLNVVGRCHVLLSNTLIFASQHKLKALKSYILQQLPNAIDRGNWKDRALFTESCLRGSDKDIYVVCFRVWSVCEQCWTQQQTKAFDVEQTAACFRWVLSQKIKKAGRPLWKGELREAQEKALFCSKVQFQYNNNNSLIVCLFVCL